MPSYEHIHQGVDQPSSDHIRSFTKREIARHVALSYTLRAFFIIAGKAPIGFIYERLRGIVGDSSEI
jgi:hypothetical protein